MSKRQVRPSKKSLNSPEVKAYMQWLALPTELKQKENIKNIKEYIAHAKDNSFAGGKSYQTLTKYTKIEGFQEELLKLQNKNKPYFVFTAKENLMRAGRGIIVKTKTVTREDNGWTVTTETETELPPNVKANETILKLFGELVDKVEVTQNSAFLDACKELDKQNDREPK